MMRWGKEETVWEASMEEMDPRAKGEKVWGWWPTAMGKKALHGTGVGSGSE